MGIRCPNLQHTCSLMKLVTIDRPPVDLHGPHPPSFPGWNYGHDRRDCLPPMNHSLIEIGILMTNDCTHMVLSSIPGRHC